MHTMLRNKLGLHLIKHLYIGRSRVLYMSPSSFSSRRRRLEDATSSLSMDDKKRDYLDTA